MGRGDKGITPESKPWQRGAVDARSDGLFVEQLGTVHPDMSDKLIDLYDLSSSHLH